MKLYDFQYNYVGNDLQYDNNVHFEGVRFMVALVLSLSNEARADLMTR